MAATVCALSACARPRVTPVHEAELTWTAPLDRDHALVGRIWEVAARRFVSEAELNDALAGAHMIVLGEKHDNADHHRLQRRLIEHLVARGRRPALVLEMIDARLQAAVEQSRKEHPHEVDELATAVSWQDSGWPPWSLYRPIFAAAFSAQLPIVAAGLDRDAAMGIARNGVAALDPQLVQRYGLAAPLSPADEAALADEMREAHCNLMPEAMLGSMVLVQRARDALLADKLQGAGAGPHGALLIAGNGHSRRDRGVPAQLARAHGQAGAALAIGMLEVDAARQEPGQYELPFDYVWFTPRATAEDPCAQLRERFKPQATHSSNVPSFLGGS